MPTSADGERERAKIVERAGVVGAGTLLSRVLGYGRDAVIAALFNTRETDTFWAALTIPNALRQLLAEGAVSSAVVPVLSKRLAEEGDDAGRAFFARARGVSLLVLVVVSVLGVVFARQLAWLFAGGFAADPAKLELTVNLTRVMFPYIFFMGSAALGMAALNAKKRFAVAAFAPALFSVGIVGAVFLLRGRLAEPAMALAIGVMAGGVLQVVAQLPALRRIGFVQRPRLDFADPHVRAMLKRILPMTFGLGVYYVDLVLSRRFLSELGDGAQSYFSWASRLCDLPQGIFVMAISSASLPSLATFAAKGEHEELVKTWAQGMRLTLFVAIPCSVALVVLGEPIVILLYERGVFDARSSAETARALAWQGGAIFTVAATRQLVPAFHALGDTRTPVIVSALDLVAFVALAYWLKGSQGHVGISIAIAGSSAVQMVLLAWGLRLRLGTLRGGEIFASAARVLGASILAAAAAGALAHLLKGTLWRGLPGLASSLAFVAVFALAAWALGAKELTAVAAPIRRRLARRRR
ncbi:MAG: murein biosynthesis integral membrane protein MurJ [Labilithrix sp.]|nr:murein biosynthesis integral membrane protein MurJ [Labilithrix sp.]MCW5813778.1 murein biosynthesis integral membrane protein MurJ [Labilithrix sp.]